MKLKLKGRLVIFSDINIAYRDFEVRAIISRRPIFGDDEFFGRVSSKNFLLFLRCFEILAP